MNLDNVESEIDPDGTTAQVIASDSVGVDTIIEAPAVGQSSDIVIVPRIDVGAVA